MIEGSRAGQRGRARAVAAAALGLSLPHAAHAAGQLELVPDVPILVGLVVLFLVLVLPINQLLFKPIFRVLDDREERIAGTRKRGEQLEQEAQRSLERYQSSLQSVREEAEAERRSLLESARGDALAVTSGARAEVERRDRLGSGTRPVRSRSLLCEEGNRNRRRTGSGGHSSPGAYR